MLMTDIAANILLTLRAGPMSAAEIAAGLRVNATTVSRQLNRLGQRVIKTGAGRSTRWYLPRPLAATQGLHMLPVYRVDLAGTVSKIAHLYAVYPAESYLVEYFREGNTDQQPETIVEWTYFESLPWWLTDMRPQGFLGRSFANQLRAKGELIDADPRTWSEDQVLSVLAAYPQDSIGNLLVGEQAYQAWLLRSETLPMSDSEAAERAESIARGEHFNSSAQGEQPKFTACRAGVECIVKFSGRVEHTAMDTVANRWADLLQVEALSSKVLNRSLPDIAADNRSFRENGRTFMASRRFDRTLPGGRVGVISLSSLDAEFVGQANQPWPVIMQALANSNVVTELALVHSKIVWAFGQLIANSDMHLGNLSVLNEVGRPYRLAPIYDMLPMHFAPTSAGDLPMQTRAIGLCSHVSKVHWELAYPMAIELWQQVVQHPGISEHFKVLAQRQLEVVQDFAAVIHRMAN
ncbi:type II toxin-antitoxin system HipA family toxin YjjJ [Aliidiomarina maris]|uniref:Regulatory ArsR family protein n=2 Tax=Aliidiomarina maris TaxID=531312 RepID=A0A327X6B7_9GAMM|nr:regulatory ArsR family protein [Aliidiomarina maris]RUO24729.1 transcriptional regulator [Aliidiomarina maris]